MELKITERLALLDVLPKEGSYITLKIIHQLRESLSFSEDEIKQLNLRMDGATVQWDVKQEVIKDE